jgi:hypothetical protein
MIKAAALPHLPLTLMLCVIFGCASPAPPSGNRQAAARSGGGGQRTSQTGGETSAPETYFTGNGGRGMRLGIIVPESEGLNANQAYLPAMVQGVLVSAISKYSAISVLDRVSLDRVIAETLDPTYEDNLDIVRLGHVAQVGYLMTGKIIRTTTGYTLQINVSDTSPDAKTIAAYSGTSTAAELDDHTAIQKASQDLLTQMGVRLTNTARAELGRANSQQAINAEAALARGLTAQRQGTEVAALSYFFQAVALDPSLLEAANRASVVSADISSGNIGEDVRNDIVWRRNWVARLTEAEQSFDQFNKTTSMPYTLFYPDEIKQGTVNYQNETVTLSIETYLRPSQTWGRSVGIPMQRTLRAVYDGLQATQRTGDWNLRSWPRQSVTNLNSFVRQSNNFTIAAELLNDRYQVIGRQSFRMDGYWEFTYNGNTPAGVSISDDVRRTVDFTVKADDITNRLTIRIASVNGVDAETAARNGVMQIRALTRAEYDQNGRYNNIFNFVLGEIKGLSSDGKKENIARNGFDIYVPGSIWGDPVTAIGARAFFIPAAASIYLPDSVTYIGAEAFYSLDRISIGANVTMEDNVFAVEAYFVKKYRNNNRMAGVYTYSIPLIRKNPNITKFSDDNWTFSRR